MASKKSNPVWAFFASVKLALFLLFILAATSIIGTVIPQNNPSAFYVEQYGAKTAKLMQVLQATDMYNAWWFLTLLTLFALNLTVCSLERVPRVFRLLRQDNLATPPERLAKMGLVHEATLAMPADKAVQRVLDLFAGLRWHAARRESEGGTMLFAQRGGWTRFGVYIVHTSILVIFAGALVGSASLAKFLGMPAFAFKGSIMLPETRQSDHVFSFGTGEKIDLGFTLRCDYFTIDYYPGGMPKTYLSKVTVIENGAEQFARDITVNSPLTYKGITFYQSSYEPYSEFLVSLTNAETGAATRPVLPAARQISWDEEGVQFGILNVESSRRVAKRVKIWLKDEQGPPSSFWLDLGRTAIVERPDDTYQVEVKQLYATGLQVAKDPGVWLVYLGCGLMLLGLFVAFFLSHRRLYAWVERDGAGSRIVFAGSTNKNKVGFEKKFNQLISLLDA